MEEKVFFKGSSVKVLGCFPKFGMRAPDFKLAKADLTNFTLSDASGKRVLLNIFPSLDTSTCAMSVRKFNTLAGQMKNTLVLCVSKDLPFAQSRFCVAEDITNVIALSDVRHDSNFGEDYGVKIVDGALDGLFARAVVIIDEKGKVVYADINKEISEEPNYDAALKMLEQ